MLQRLSERLFGVPHARLYPLVWCGDFPGLPSGVVATPRGSAVLLAVGSEHAVVLLGGRRVGSRWESPTGRTIRLPHRDVWPARVGELAA